MRKFLFTSFALVVLFFTVPAISENPRFKLGVIAPLSGPLAEYGTAVRNGFELARTQNPKLFDTIEIRFEDDQYDSKRSVAAFTKLRELDRVDLIYLWGSGPSQAVAPIAEARGYPLVIMSIDPSPAQGRRWVIRFGNYSEQYILKLLDFFRSNGVKRIGLLRTELGYTNSMADALRANLLAGESVTEISTLQPGDMDFKSVLARMQGKQFDALGVYLMSGQISQFYREIKGRLPTKLTFGTDFFESSSEVRSAGSAIDGAVFPNNAVEQWFLDRYRDRFNNDSQVTFAANAFDFAMLAAETFVNSSHERFTSEDIRARIVQARSHVGASGKFSFQTSDKGGQFFEFPIVIKKIEGDKIVTLTE